MQSARSRLPPLILVGGPPRSGTTILAKLLNDHPRICAVVDNEVYESDALFSYTTGAGLIGAIKEGKLDSRSEAEEFLYAELVGVDADSPPMCHGIASSESTSKFKQSDTRPPTVAVPLDFLHSERLRICLKSPMIVSQLGRLLEFFPQAHFVLTFRHPLETAESMYHIAETKWRSSYHRDWERRARESEHYRPPVHGDFVAAWADASGFQKCVLYATSQLGSLVQQYRESANARIFVYDHARLVEQPELTFDAVATHLGVGVGGFTSAASRVRRTGRPVPDHLRAEFEAINERVGATQIYARACELSGG